MMGKALDLNSKSLGQWMFWFGHLPTVRTGPRQSLWSFISSSMGRMGLLKNQYSIRLFCFGLVFTIAQYMCIRYLIYSCHRELSQASLETGKLKTLV